MRALIAVMTAALGLASAADAATIYPIDRADILAQSPFDLKVEFDGVVKPDDVKVTINGKPAAEVLGKELAFVAKEDGVEASAVRLNGATLATPGTYKVEAQAGGDSKSVTWQVYATPAVPKAKNVIFFLGDGLSVAHRTAARLMAKGMTEGKANGRLAMDDLQYMAMIGTSATNSISTDSANSMSAYMTGHKTAVNALGVYADRTKNSFDDPKVETIAEALRRLTKKSIGIVSNAELVDATPAALIAHTRSRADKPQIAEMFLDTKPEVVLGGGAAFFLPKSNPRSDRKDDTDVIKAFQDAGYSLAIDKAGLDRAGGSNSGKILGLFHPGNMDTTLDREFLKKGTVAHFPDQPGLVDMTRVALDQLSKNPDGFFLMVEGGSIDKMSHPMDWERAVVDTIEFDKAVGLGMEFAKKHPDTLIIVTGDHTHGMSIIGTIDDDKAGPDPREKIGVYADAGFPNYEDKNGDGYPDRVDVSRRLAMFSNNFPDYYETFRPKLDGPFQPSLVDRQLGVVVANKAYKDVPGAMLRIGILPPREREAVRAVHSVDDVVLQASGPGAEAFRGYLEESDVYRLMVDAMALSPAAAAPANTAGK